MFVGSIYDFAADAEIMPHSKEPYVRLVIGTSFEFLLKLSHAKALHKLLGLAIENALMLAGGTTLYAPDAGYALCKCSPSIPASTAGVCTFCNRPRR